MANLTKEQLLKLVDYRDGELYWSDNRGRSNCKGKRVGWLDKDGYRVTEIDYAGYRIHRLVFLMHHGYMPDIVDHIDGDITNNRIENLRAATSNQSQHNKRRSRNSKNPAKGVTLRPNGKWWVRVGIEGKRIALGCYDDLEEAIRVATEARNKYHGEFAHHG